MKRRNFLGFLAGALVAAREAFSGDMVPEGELTLPATEPEDPKPRAEIPPDGIVVNYNGRMICGTLRNVVIEHKPEIDFDTDNRKLITNSVVTITAELGNAMVVMLDKGKVSIHNGT